jgi:hypothetical protein
LIAPITGIGATSMARLSALVGQLLRHPGCVGQVGTRTEHVAGPGDDDRVDVVGGGLLDRLP